jgi:glucose-6-phosphate isomerase
MQPKIAQALQDMSALEAGSIANPDEQRMVGHYWLRNHALALNEGIYDELRENEQKRKDFVERILNAKNGKTFKNLLCIGIGGSALGPQLLSDAFGAERDGLQPFFIDNTDPDGIGCVLRRLEPELAQTLVMVTSKSGSTPEPRNGLAEVRDVFRRKNLPFTPQAIAVTCKGSALDQLACEEQWLARFPMWDWIGGRTSLFSNVGLLPAALQRISTENLLQGAAEMDAFTRETDVFRNPALMLALSWYACADGHGKRNMVVLPYRDALVLFPKYLQQLVMESLGKKLDLNGNVVHQGLTVYGNKGSSDQHA